MLIFEDQDLVLLTLQHHGKCLFYFSVNRNVIDSFYHLRNNS